MIEEIQEITDNHGSGDHSGGHSFGGYREPEVMRKICEESEGKKSQGSNGTQKSHGSHGSSEGKQ